MMYLLGMIVVLYAMLCLWLCWQWSSMHTLPTKKVALPPDFKLTLIVPVRNEAENIGALLNDLTQQTIRKNHFEIIIANDASTDDTVAIVKKFIGSKVLDLQLLDLQDEAVSSPKKRAITQAMKIAKGELIVTTDGDCRMGEKWLETMARTYLQTGAKLISGPVCFSTFPLPPTTAKRAFAIFQTIEFASLIGTGGCLIQAGLPTMCNGANLAYQRQAFEEVGGYEGMDQIASGDDEFLLQKINQRFPDAICFLKNQEAIVSTQPQPNWGAFYQQRVRWASKWAVNRRVATMTVAIFVFLVNLVTLFLWGELLRGGVEDGLFLIILLLKLLPEFLFLALIIHFLGHKKWIVFIPFVQVIYPFYVLFFGITAQRKGYEWKGRRLR
ncbi:MAG: glycosyltransferase [Spirosomataceae bacterium]